MRFGAIMAHERHTAKRRRAELLLLDEQHALAMKRSGARNIVSQLRQWPARHQHSDTFHHLGDELGRGVLCNAHPARLRDLPPDSQRIGVAGYVKYFEMTARCVIPPVVERPWSIDLFGRSLVCWRPIRLLR